MALRAQPAAEQAKTVAAHEAGEKLVALRAQLHTPCKLVSGKKRSLGELSLGGGPRGIRTI